MVARSGIEPEFVFLKKEPTLLEKSTNKKTYANQANTPSRTRTYNLRLRRPLLYPVELLVLRCLFFTTSLETTAAEKGIDKLYIKD